MKTAQRPHRAQNSNGNGRPQIDNEPEPPFPEQHQRRPGLQKNIRPRPEYRAPQYKSAAKLQGKVALITGGDSGIGRAVAVLYGREGADVAINFLPSERADAEETKRVVEEYGRECLLLPGDLTDRKFCDETVARVVKEFGKLDILVSNAAYQNRIDSIEEVTDEEFDRTFKTNAYAFFWLCRAAVKEMRPGSAIIVTSSKTGLLGSEKLVAYSATKGAINALTKALSMELVEKGIRVNAVAPGPVWTPLNVVDRGHPAKKVAKFGQDTLFGRPAQPEELAPAYVFLASDADSSYITGTVLEVLGDTAG
jgi:NAD(P)-dependent dehydrogenase (short-subunit alcohol dehydrogenase family)